MLQGTTVRAIVGAGPVKVEAGTNHVEVRLDQSELAATPAIAALQTAVGTKQSQLFAGEVEGGHRLLLQPELFVDGGFDEGGEPLQGDTVRALKVSSPLVATSDNSHVYVSLDQSQLAATSAIAALQTEVAGKQDVLGFVPDEDPSSYQILQNGVIRALKVSSPLVATSDMSQVHVSLDPAGVNPFWVAGKVDSNASVLVSKGKVAFTVTQTTTGNYRVDFASPHPAGVHYVISLTAASANFWVDQSSTTASSFLIALRASNFGNTSAQFHISVLA
jgi:hypothetical protein